MKMLNKWIVGLLSLGVALFVAVQFIVIPRQNARAAAASAAQLDPATHSLATILKYKSAYMGDASNDAGLFHNLPLSDAGCTFELFPEALRLQVNYQQAVSAIGEEKAKRVMIYNATAAFALIQNLQTVTYAFSDGSFEVNRGDMKGWYADFAHILTAQNWKLEVQQPLADGGYVSRAAQTLLRQKGS